MAITGRRLQAAIDEAERFLERARALELAASVQITDEPDGVIWNQPKYSGAVRRASMDLTRSLADLRRY